MAVEVADGISVITALLCEEVRPELNGKWTLLGAFSGDIVVPEIPANIRFGLYLDAKIGKDYHGPMFIRFRLDDQEVLQIKGELEAKMGYIAVPLGSVIVGFQKAGTIFVEMSLDAQKWVSLLSKELMVGTFKDGILTSSAA